MPTGRRTSSVVVAVTLALIGVFVVSGAVLIIVINSLWDRTPAATR